MLPIGRREWLYIASVVALAGFSRSALADVKVVDALTIKNIARFSPRARADLVESLVTNKQLLLDSGIDTPRRLYHFMAQIAAETGGLVRIDENLRYSAEQLRKIFPKRVKDAETASRIAYKPVEIAMFVYGGRLGNKPPPSLDGWNYRGSGYLQLTGASNFKDRGEELKLELFEKPDLAREPKVGLQAACLYWKARNINAMADKDKIEAVRLAVNGGTNGLDHARFWLGRAQKVFGAVLEPGLEAPVLMGDELEREGIASVLRAEGFSLGTELEAPQLKDIRPTLIEYQKANGLPETGELDEDTIYNLMDPDNVPKE